MEEQKNKEIRRIEVPVKYKVRSEQFSEEHSNAHQELHKVAQLMAKCMRKMPELQSTIERSEKKSKSEIWDKAAKKCQLNKYPEYNWSYDSESGEFVGIPKKQPKAEK